MPEPVQIRETVRMSSKRRSAVLGVAVSAVAAIGVAVWAPAGAAANIFLLECGLVLIFLAFLGVAMNGRVMGVAIDSRNRVSLSKFQMIAWTVLVLSALAVLGAYRLHYGAPVGPLSSAGPLVISIPPELLFAMGIAATSVVATPAVLSIKAAETPTAQSVASATAANNGGDTNALPTNVGKVDSRAGPEQARLSDAIKGDLVGDMLSVDLSKVQQLAITLLLLGLYGGAVYDSLWGARPDAVFKAAGYLPALSDTFVQLLAVSHAGYLLYKAAPRTSTGPTAQPGAPPPANRDPSAASGSLG